MKKLIRLIFVIGISIVLTTTAFAYTGPAFVATDNLDVYEKGGWNSSIVDCLPRWTDVTIEEDAGYGWYKISYEGGTGYVAGYYLLFGVSEHIVQSEQPNFTTDIQQITSESNICASDVNMRSGPSLDSSVLYCLSNGTSINVHGVCGDWYEVDYNGVIGYIYKIYVSWNGQVSTIQQQIVEEVSQPIIQPTTGNDIVDTALQYLGVPYVWGGQSESGFDCSGLVYTVYKQNGISINRVAQDMYYNGREVSTDCLQPGDILLFGSSIYSIRHVGIYSGDGMVIHSSYGDVVRNQPISQIQGMYLVGARRLVDFN